MQTGLVRKIVLAVGSFALSLGLFELGLRAWGFDPLGDLSGDRAMPLRPSRNPEIEYELTPGARGGVWDTEVVVNSSGFRGPEFPRDKGAAFRIVVLGDSIAFGSYVPAGADFPSQLGEILPPDYETLNLAVGGYDTTNEAAVLAEHGILLRPDLVVVAYCLNDTGVVSANLDYVRRLERYRSPLYRLRLAALIGTRLDRRRVGDAGEWFNRPDVFRERYAGRIDPIGEDEAELRGWMAQAGKRLPGAWYADEFRVGRLRHALGRIGALSRQHGFPVLLLIIPWLELKDGRYPFAAAHGVVAHEAGRAGIEVLDLTEALLAQDPLRLRRETRPDDPCHPNERGHRLIAQALARWLLEP